MGIWNFYYSGILYGIIDDGADSLRHRSLDPFTGTFKNWEPFTDDSFYYTLCKRSLIDFFNNLEEYELGITAECSEFTTSSGEIFCRRDTDSYIQRQIKFPKDFLTEDGKIYAVLMSGRDFTGVLIKEGAKEPVILQQWRKLYKAAPYAVSRCQTFFVETRDGEKLASDVYLPVGNGAPKQFPSVLVRTPYGKSEGCEQYFRFVQRGFAVVIQDIRGREDSTGAWLPNYYEVEDGDDTLNWIADQPFSDGQVAMTGGSYLGYVQWAAAASNNPHLKAMLSSVCAGSAFVDVPRRGGCFNSGMLAWAFAMTEQRMRPDLMARDDWDEVLNIRPIRDIARKTLGHEVPFLDTWLDHMNCDDLWKRSSWKERSTGAVVPALIMSGWFDDNGMGTTEALDLVREYYPPGTYKAVLGPWMHSGNANYDLHGYYMGDCALRYDMDLLCFQWLEHFLNGVPNGIETTAPVEYYTIGENRWKCAGSWPVPSAISTRYYLGEEDSAQGILSTVKPDAEGGFSYDYDPQNPSTHIIDMSENELEVPEDYTEEEKRPDVLCYSTPVLDQDLTVTGDILATLYLSSDCPDTDLMVRLTDVSENGTSIKLADGVISAKYRNGFEKPEFLEPGKIYQVNIRTTKISNTFKKGHRLRFTVTSSAKNFIFPNSNTCEGFDSAVTRIARNTIHHGGNCASHIVLPVEKE